MSPKYKEERVKFPKLGKKKSLREVGLKRLMDTYFASQKRYKMYDNWANMSKTFLEPAYWARQAKIEQQYMNVILKEVQRRKDERSKNRNGI